MIINRIYETQNLLSLHLVSFLVGLRTYQHPCIYVVTCKVTLLVHMTSRIIQLVIHFVDPRCYNTSITLPEDNPLKLKRSVHKEVINNIQGYS